MTSCSFVFHFAFLLVLSSCCQVDGGWVLRKQVQNSHVGVLIADCTNTCGEAEAAIPVKQGVLQKPLSICVAECMSPQCAHLQFRELEDGEIDERISVFWTCVDMQLRLRNFKQKWDASRVERDFPPWVTDLEKEFFQLSGHRWVEEERDKDSSDNHESLRVEL